MFSYYSLRPWHTSQADLGKIIAMGPESLHYNIFNCLQIQLSKIKYANISFKMNLKTILLLLTLRKCSQVDVCVLLFMDMLDTKVEVTSIQCFKVWEVCGDGAVKYQTNNFPVFVSKWGKVLSHCWTLWSRISVVICNWISHVWASCMV